MDAYSYSNIFETKGIEYIIVIAFLLLIIPFWQIITRPQLRQNIKRVLGNLTEAILRIPQGLYYSKNHMWAQLFRSGDVRIGFDDLLTHLTGEVEVKSSLKPGDRLAKGEIVALIEQNGKQLSVVSPISGTLLSYNNDLNADPSLINNDPYGEGWLATIKPERWISETADFLTGEDAVNWEKGEFVRFKDFIANSMSRHSASEVPVILQEGGELIDNPLSEMPEEIWVDFQKEFLNI